jgi:hypothetical protein
MWERVQEGEEELVLHFRDHMMKIINRFKFIIRSKSLLPFLAAFLDHSRLAL